MSMQPLVERAPAAPTEPRRKMAGARSNLASWVSYRVAVAGALLLALASLLPLYWMIIGSFKLQVNAMSVPPEFWPAAPTTANWQRLLGPDTATLRWFLNSVIVSLLTTFFAVVTSALAGYVFGKKVFPGKQFLFWLVIITMMLPKQISLIPLFVLMKNLSWVNTFQGMVAPWIAYPFGIFLIKQYMPTIPDELLDAAKIDGASEVGIFSRVILPLTKPAVGALGIFSFVNAWNDYLWQLIMTTTRSMFTLPIGVSQLVSSLQRYDLGVAMAGATFAFIPMLIVFLVFQDYFVKGITMGSVKG